MAAVTSRKNALQPCFCKSETNKLYVPKVKCVCKGQPYLGSGESKLRSVAWPKVGFGNATLGPRFSKRQSIQRLSGLCNPSSYVKFSRQLLPHVGESKTVLDSGFQIPGTGWIPVFVSRTWILDSKTQLARISDSISKIFPDFKFHKQKFLRFRKPDSITKICLVGI